MEQLNQHGSREKVRSSKITTAEIVAVNNVLQMTAHHRVMESSAVGCVVGPN